jgi:DNA replication protein DnaC
MQKLHPKGITKAHLQMANIPEDYWSCDFFNYLGPEEVAEASKKYLRTLAEKKGEGVGILFGGPPGPGKTTIAAVLLKYLVRAGWTCWMTSLGEIVENIQKSWNAEKGAHNDSAEFLQRCREADFLLIDDLGKEHAGPSGFSSTTFDNLIRYRIQHRLPTILTTNLNRQTIKNRYGDALLSLIEGKCTIITVTGADIRRSVQKPKLAAEV